ncbi:hypothetical protein MTP99_002011 [Tenebrio molitor]|nr:hypothetical protein MTP99_002011 [Tenebrio molitor]
MDVCVCLAGADGRVVGGRATLFRHHREVSRVRIPGRMASHGCCVVCVSCRPEKKGELRRGEGGRGWPGKVPRSPAAPPKEKGKKLVDRKVPDKHKLF